MAVIRTKENEEKKRETDKKIKNKDLSVHSNNNPISHPPSAHHLVCRLCRIICEKQKRRRRGRAFLAVGPPSHEIEE
jgi:hypothetical protein